MIYTRWENEARYHTTKMKVNYNKYLYIEPFSENQILSYKLKPSKYRNEKESHQKKFKSNNLHPKVHQKISRLLQ